MLVSIVGLFSAASHAALNDSASCTKPDNALTIASFDQVRDNEGYNGSLNGKSIRNIDIVRFNVFDEKNPKENNAIYRWLNDLHIISTEQTVANDLLFKSQQTYNDTLLMESERILRHRKYIYDARIRPSLICDEFVDIEVATKDTWTITPGVSVSRSGGETSSKVSIAESNFLGSGKFISFAKANDNERTEYTLRFRDPNILGSRRKTAIEISENSDGHRQYIDFELPFFALDSKTSYGVSVEKEKRLDPIYLQEDKLFEIKHNLSHYNVFYGLSDGYIDDRTRRWRVGLTYQLDDLNGIENQPNRNEHRRLLYPWVEYSFIENHFTKIQNYQSIKRTEDLNLGRNFRFKLGYSQRNIANDDSRIVVDFSSKNAMKFGNKLYTGKASVKGYWNQTQGKAQGLHTQLSGAYYHFINPDWVFFTGIKANHVANPMPEKQLFLGGETGLRGYPVRFNEGDKNLLLTVEQRYYTDSYFLQLVRLATAFYFDVGRSWSPQLSQSPEHNRWYSSVGVGLRLTPSRVDANHVIHVDLATPLNERGNLDKIQFIVKVKQSF